MSEQRSLFREAHTHNTYIHTYIHTDAPNPEKFIERVEEFIQGTTQDKSAAKAQANTKKLAEKVRICAYVYVCVCMRVHAGVC